MKTLAEWLEEQLTAAGRLYEQRGIERLKLEGEYAAFNAVLEYLKTLSVEASDEQRKEPK